MKLTYPRIILYSLTSLLVLLLACADDMPPPGGEIDKASPYIIGSAPMNGAVDVSSGNTVVLYFSEHIAKPPAGQTIFISPRPVIDPKIKWQSDRVTITFADSFEVDQTYIISAGAQVKDLRGNQPDSALTVAFSTGSTIAKGRTAGLISDKNGQPQSGLLVGLYDPTTIDTASVIDSIYPSYVIPTNAEGLFSIGCLPDAEFRMIAFKDINKNGRFNPGKEPFALPDRSIIIGGSTPIEDLMLTVQVEDTTSVEILAVSQTSDGLLRLRLSRSIDLKQLHQHPERCLLNLVGDTITAQDILLGELSANAYIVFPARALLEDADAQESVINFVTSDLADGEYSVTLTYDSTRSPISFSSVQIGTPKDENAPVLIQILPGNQPEFAEDVQIDLSFSEPLDTSLITPETFLLKLVPDSLIPISSKWMDPLRLRLSPESLLTGGRYKLSITEFELADKAENRLGDSMRVHYFSVIDSDSLGSISGETIVSITGKENDFVFLTFQKIGGRAFDLTTSDGTFNIELPGGRYLLSGFIDSDNDSVKSVGSVSPYKLGETMSVYPDTISVRTRFETAGIQFEFR